jgi:hypothetical protein
MESHKRLYWPFPLLPDWQQTDLYKREIQLLEEAHAAGYRPYVFDGEDFGMGDERTRWIEFIYRGRDRGEPRWEPLFVDHGMACQAGPILGFSDWAAIFVVGPERLKEVAFRWLQGLPLERVFEGLPVSIPQQEGQSQKPGPPCPTCGASLRTMEAQQCFHCGADWHQRETNRA